MRLLLVEDDPLIGDGIKAGLVRQGFAVDWFSDGLEGHEAAGAAEYDAVILDLSLPGMDGLDVLRSWRARGNDVPVLILTARGDMAQRVEGLNLGADDYLGKPFALLELVARLRALVRRSHGQAASLLRYGAVVFDQESRQFTLDGREVTLSPRESMLAELFLLNRGVVLSRTRIEEKMYTWGEEISSNAVEVYVHNIRRKLGADFIRTVHGAGYALGDPGEY